MSENLKKFMEAVSRESELVGKVNNMTRAQLISLAKDMGIVLTDADFGEVGVQELEDDDLDTVAGGTAVGCTCAMGGGGAKDDNDKTCACVVAGLGYSKDGEERCFCALGGFGYDY